MWLGRQIWEKNKKGFGEGQCARCGEYCNLTIDHFIPKSKVTKGMNKNNNSNLIGLCKTCNQEKADRIVTPDWYQYLSEERKENLKRYMRYTRGAIRNKTDDPEVLEYLDNL